jgi:hypothetical protein
MKEPVDNMQHPQDNPEDEITLADAYAIDEKIARGLAQLDRGEGIPSDQLRSRLKAAKLAWFAGH